MHKALQKMKQKFTVKNFKRTLCAAKQWYAPSMTVVLLSLYSVSAHAQLAFNENEGMFSMIVCPMVKWIINLTIPAAMICMIAAGIEFFRGEEIKGIVKQMLQGVVALTACMAMVGIVSWIASKFGFMSTCNF